MDKAYLEKLLNACLETGADYAEIFYENTINKTYRLADSKLKDLVIKPIKGIGVRIACGNDVIYGSTNNLDDISIKTLISNLVSNFKGNRQITVSLEEEKLDNINPIKKMFKDQEKLDYLKNIDKIAREYKEINQVNARFVENNRKFTIACSTGKYITSSNMNLRLYADIYASLGSEKASTNLSIGGSCGYELFDDVDIVSLVKEKCENAISKLSAKYFKGGELPVVIGPGFGAVIFHEACGHGLEATAVARNESAFAGKLGTVIASDKVTLVDDGTISNYWGSNTIDDEGNKTKRNILIDKGILSDYLVDELNNRKMHMKANGCSRRENYTYMPTSRMSNTYLMPGTDKVDDMIKSIKLGVYCVDMGGGSVNPNTGDFNFSVSNAYLIEDGKITDQIKGISLIGNSRDVLLNVEAVSDDLEFSCGMCGSLSGYVPVTIGQPTIKVSKILVGGRE